MEKTLVKSWLPIANFFYNDTLTNSLKEKCTEVIPRSRKPKVHSLGSTNKIIEMPSTYDVE